MEPIPHGCLCSCFTAPYWTAAFSNQPDFSELISDGLTHSWRGDILIEFQKSRSPCPSGLSGERPIKIFTCTSSKATTSQIRSMLSLTSFEAPKESPVQLFIDLHLLGITYRKLRSALPPLESSSGSGLLTLAWVASPTNLQDLLEKGSWWR